MHCIAIESQFTGSIYLTHKYLYFAWNSQYARKSPYISMSQNITNKVISKSHLIIVIWQCPHKVSLDHVTQPHKVQQTYTSNNIQQRELTRKQLIW